MTEVFWSLLSFIIIINIILVSTYLWLYVKVKYQIWRQQPNLRCLQKEDLFPNNNIKTYTSFKNCLNHVFTLHHSRSSPLAEEKATPEYE